MATNSAFFMHVSYAIASYSTLNRAISNRLFRISMTQLLTFIDDFYVLKVKYLIFILYPHSTIRYLSHCSSSSRANTIHLKFHCNHFQVTNFHYTRASTQFTNFVAYVWFCTVLKCTTDLQSFLRDPCSSILRYIQMHFSYTRFSSGDLFKIHITNVWHASTMTFKVIKILMFKIKNLSLIKIARDDPFSYFS